MRKWLVMLFISVVVAGFSMNQESLRSIYSRPPAEWPKPNVDPGINWTELGVLPAGPLEGKIDSMRSMIELGKQLFFDNRLSGSLKISCGTCHQPELSWTDGVDRSLGHEGTINRRNAPSLQNVWFYNRLFWDGRSHSLEDQAFAPINSESEMHGDMRALPRNLKKVKGYLSMFEAAFGDPEIDPDRIGTALAIFQRTIKSRKSRFDEFLLGKRKALTNSEIRGLHLFRTKAGCMNCHHGPMFSDQGFHNNGFSRFDTSYYLLTHREEDKGKLRTPSLRDVNFTGPWMHDGSAKDLDKIIDWYNLQKYNNRLPLDPSIRQLGLKEREKKDLLAFLKAISAPPLEFNKPTRLE
jgi:cytochrome c peroxidase